jgi:hypothetical protein
MLQRTGTIQRLLDGVRIPGKRKLKSIFAKFVGSSYVYKTMAVNLITGTLITLLTVMKQQTPHERRRGSAREYYVNLPMTGALIPDRYLYFA